MLVGKGNTGQAMKPGFTYQEQQRVMDEIPKEIIVPAHNALIDALEGADGAEGIGISATGITATNVEDAVAEVKAALDAAVIGAGAVATAGSQNQVYRKYSGADYAAEWTADGGFEIYTHSKASTVHTLTMTSPKSKNHILNSASTATVNGITFTVNADKTVTVNGTATGAATIYLMGAASSETVLFSLVANREYAIKGTGNAAISIDLINDETVLKSVASADGTYTPSTAVGITAIALTVASGNTISNVTVSPMLEIGATCSPYEQYGANSNGIIKFVATADYAAGDTWVVNGQAFTARTLDGKELTNACFVSGAIVTCFANGTVLSFTVGGEASNGFSTYTHVKSGSVHALTGVGLNIMFTATADFIWGDSFSVNGTPCTAITQDGESLTDGFFKSGSVVSCFINNTTLNFNKGGAALGFSIKPYAATPTGTAADNTVALVGAAPVSDYTFSAEPPTMRSDGNPLSGGEVYISTSQDTSRCPFNALKKNKLMVYPYEAYQYNGTSWTEKDAFIYQGGAWHPFKRYLFHNGPVSGYDWVSGFDSNINRTAGTSLGLWGTPVCAGEWALPFDFTGVSWIVFSCTEHAWDGNATTGMSTDTALSDNPLSPTTRTSFLDIASVGTYALDVRGISGVQYLKLYAGISTGTYVRIVIGSVWAV